MRLNEKDAGQPEKGHTLKNCLYLFMFVCFSVSLQATGFPTMIRPKSMLLAQVMPSPSL